MNLTPLPSPAPAPASSLPCPCRYRSHIITPPPSSPHLRVHQIPAPTHRILTPPTSTHPCRARRITPPLYPCPLQHYQRAHLAPTHPPCIHPCTTPPTTEPLHPPAPAHPAYRPHLITPRTLNRLHSPPFSYPRVDLTHPPPHHQGAYTFHPTPAPRTTSTRDRAEGAPPKAGRGNPTPIRCPSFLLPRR